MKLIKFDLPMNGIKVTNLEELRDNVTFELLVHYKSGLLAKWLRSRGMRDIEDKLSALQASEDAVLLCDLCAIFDIECDLDIAAALLEQSEEGLNDRILADIAGAVLRTTAKALLTSAIYGRNNGLYWFSTKVEYGKDEPGSYNGANVFECGEEIISNSSMKTVAVHRGRIAGVHENTKDVVAGDLLFLLEDIEGLENKSTPSSRILLRYLSNAFRNELEGSQSATGKAVLSKCLQLVELAIGENGEDKESATLQLHSVLRQIAIKKLNP